MDPLSRTTWSDVQHLCTDDVRHFDDYLERVRKGALDAREYLFECSQAIPDAETIRVVHQQMFQTVHKTAGRFREELETAHFGPDRELTGAHPTYIQRELLELRDHTLDLSAHADTDDELIQTVCFAHAKLLRIHPFLDGNGRVARLLAEHIGERIDCPPLRTPTHDEYVTSLYRSQKENNLRPLAKALFGTRLPEHLAESPYSLELKSSREETAVVAQLKSGELVRLDELVNAMDPIQREKDERKRDTEQTTRPNEQRRTR